MEVLKIYINRLLALFLLLFISPIFISIIIVVWLDDGRPIFFKQIRFGKDNCKFKLVKFRTMKKNVPQVATHLLENPESYFNRSGRFLRKYSFDEIPQMINIIKGEMLFIGPRPALYNQKDLINLRKKSGIDKLIPGITGWAQINGRDNISIKDKVKLEEYYLANKSFLIDFKIILLTIWQIISPKNVSH